MPPASRRRMLITGATSGLGRAAAGLLAAQGHELLLAGRDPAKTEKVCAELRASGAQAVHALYCNVEDPKQIAALARRVRREFRGVDVLINNAGVYCPQYGETSEGIERTLAVNHLGYFRLAVLLEDGLADGGRIVNVSSRAHIFARMNFENLNLRGVYRPYLGAYAQSKLANLLFTFELAARAARRRIAVNALHPGIVATNMWPEHQPFQRGLWKLLKPWMRTPEEGARTIVYLAGSDAAAGVTGRYFANCRVVKPARHALDPEGGRRLWSWSERAAGVSGWAC